MLDPSKMSSSLRDIAAQGHNVGDYDTDPSGRQYRWTGVNWDPQGGGGGMDPSGRISSLKDRYSKLIDSIKGEQKVAENRQTVVTQNELGRRGILPDSGLAQQELASSLAPITSDYASKIAQTGVNEENDIQNVINAQNQLAENQRQFDVSSALSQLKNQPQSGLITVGSRSSIFDPSTGTWITNPGSGGGGGGNSSITDLQSNAGGWYNDKGQKWNDSTKEPVMTLSNGQTLYSDGSKGWTKWTYNK